jgi:hypothetical protein
LTKGRNCNLFLVVSTKAYLVISTSKGLRRVVDIVVDNIVLNILNTVDEFPK